MTKFTDRAAGALQGVQDAATGTDHPARTWQASTDTDERHIATHERWHAGLPPRNQYERDAYATFEAEVAGGMKSLARVGGQASRVEAERAAEAQAKAGE